MTAVLMGIGLLGCKRPPSLASLEPKYPFVITNAGSTTNSDWIVQTTNGIYLALSPNRITIYFQPTSTISVGFNAQTSTPTNIVIETPGSKEEPGQWISDFNADGIADARRIKGKNGHEIFYKGEWVSSKPAGGGMAFISFGGTNLAVVFDGASWKAVDFAK